MGDLLGKSNEPVAHIVVAEYIMIHDMLPFLHHCKRNCTGQIMHQNNFFYV